MIVRIFGRDEVQRAVANVYDFRHLHEINKLDVLTGYLLEPIEKGERILYQHKTGKWYEFIIDEPEIIHDEGIKYYFTAVDSLVEIDGDWVEDKRPSTLANAVAEILAPTRWTVGTVTSKPAVSLTFYRISAREALDALIGAYPVEIQTRITVGTSGVTERTLDVLDRVGSDLGKRFVYDKDVTTVKRTYKQGKIITALRGYGKGEEIGEGFGRRIDFSSINGGLDYVFDPAVLAIYGRVNGGSRAHVFDYVNYEDVDDKAVLLALTQAEYLKRSVPQVSYEATVVDLGLEHEKVGIGDTVKVIDGLHRFQTRVNYLLEDEDSSNQVRLANYIKNITDSNNELIQKVGALASHAGVWDESQKIADGSYLDGVLDALNDQANATGGWTFIKDGTGLLTINAPTETAATKAVNIVGGTIRVASYKNGDGTWKWRTFITGEIVAADMITAGILKGGKVNWNLETGVLYIGDSVETASFLWDGTNISVRAGTETYSDMSYDGFRVKRALDNFVLLSAIDKGVTADTIKGRLVYADNLVNAIEGSRTLYVTTTATGDGSGRDTSNKADSVYTALTLGLEGAKYLKDNSIITINLSGSITEDVYIGGFIGAGTLIIDGGSPLTTSFKGSFYAENTQLEVIVTNCRIYKMDTSAGSALFTAENTPNLYVIKNQIIGNGVGYCHYAWRNSGIHSQENDIIDFEQTYRAWTNSIVSNDKDVGSRAGLNGYVAYAGYGGKVSLAITRPMSGTPGNVSGTASGGSVDVTDAVGTESAMSPATPPPAPGWTSQTKTFYATRRRENVSENNWFTDGEFGQGKSTRGIHYRGHAYFYGAIKSWLQGSGGYQAGTVSMRLRGKRGSLWGQDTPPAALKLMAPYAIETSTVTRGSITPWTTLSASARDAIIAGNDHFNTTSSSTSDYSEWDWIQVEVTASKKS